jgi:hypothetical protein
MTRVDVAERLYGEGRLNSFNQPPIAGSERMNELMTYVEQPTLITWEELISRPKVARPWLIPGLIRPGWLVALLGHGKEGKTTLALHLLASLASGNSWLNRAIPLAFPTIYLSFEMAEDDLAELIAPVQQGKVFQCLPQVVCDWFPPLKPSALESFLREQKIPGLLVLDSFRGAFLLGKDGEKDAGVTGTLLRTLQGVARKTGWTIVVIHHMRKSGTGDFLDGAGTGDWLAAPDSIWTWTRQQGQERGTMRVTGRMAPVPDMSILLSPSICEYGGVVLPSEAGYSDEAILKYVPDDPQGLSVERFGQGTRGKPYRYRKVQNSFIISS